MRSVHIDTELLNCFVMVAESGGFTSAAVRLSLTQSAVSVKIKKLEDLFGVRIFDRNSRSLSLTEQGHRLMPYAKQMLALHGEMLRQMSTPKKECHLRIGVVEYLAPSRLPAILADLSRRHPNIHLDVKIGLSRDLLKALDAGQLDLALAKRDNMERPGLPFLVEQLYWVIGQDISMLSSGSVPLALLPEPCSYRDAAIVGLASIGRPWREVMTTTGFAGIQVAVESGLAVSVLGASAVTPRMRRLSVDDGLPDLPKVEVCAFGTDKLDSALLRPVLSALETAIAAEQSSILQHLRKRQI